MSSEPTVRSDPGSVEASPSSNCPRAMNMDLTSEPKHIASVRKAVEAFAQLAGLGPGAIADLGLVVNEALANVIRHAYNGRAGEPISVSVDCDSSQVTVRIRDWGNGVNPAALPPREHDPATPGGLGLICLRTLVDRAEFTPQPDGMLLTISKRRP
jgi:serine/threonine-protein kinase RsbW